MEQLPIRHIAVGVWPWLSGSSQRIPCESALALQRSLDAQVADGTLRFPPGNGTRVTVPGEGACWAYFWVWDTRTKVPAKKRKRG